jgi:hypothetical protein
MNSEQRAAVIEARSALNKVRPNLILEGSWDSVLAHIEDELTIALEQDEKNNLYEPLR